MNKLQISILGGLSLIAACILFAFVGTVGFILSQPTTPSKVEPVTKQEAPTPIPTSTLLPTPTTTSTPTSTLLPKIELPSPLEKIAPTPTGTRVVQDTPPPTAFPGAATPIGTRIIQEPATPTRFIVTNPDGGNTSTICCKQCTNSKACGDSCISKDKTCTKPPGCACD